MKLKRTKMVPIFGHPVHGIISYHVQSVQPQYNKQPRHLQQTEQNITELNIHCLQFHNGSSIDARFIGFIITKCER